MQAEHTTTRREWLRTGGAMIAGGIAAPYMITSSALGGQDKPPASERLTLGFIGLGGKGTGHLRHFAKDSQVEVLALADVHRDQLRNASKHAGDARMYSDYRELLARADIDAVAISTPDHWHALNAVHACEAGKDVYCEKPLTLTIGEAQHVVNAARRNGTVFQVGSQQRSSPEFRLAVELVRNERIGKLKNIVVSLAGGNTCGWDPPEPIPDGHDWNFCLGPAPSVAYHPKRCLGTFRWFFDYSGGMVTDWGAHHMDIAQWALGKSHSGPVRVEPLKTGFPADGLFETATEFEVRNTYDNGVPMTLASTGKFNIEFTGSDGWVRVKRGSIETSNPDMQQQTPGPGETHIFKSPGHYQNWLDCIRSRQRPVADVEIGAHSVTVCHLNNIAIRTGKTIEWDPVTQRVTNDDTLNRWLNKPYRDEWTL